MKVSECLYFLVTQPEFQTSQVRPQVCRLLLHHCLPRRKRLASTTGPTVVNFQSEIHHLTNGRTVVGCSAVCEVGVQNHNVLTKHISNEYHTPHDTVNTPRTQSDRNITNNIERQQIIYSLQAVFAIAQVCPDRVRHCCCCCAQVAMQAVSSPALLPLLHRCRCRCRCPCRLGSLSFRLCVTRLHAGVMPQQTLPATGGRRLHTVSRGE
jgi:hypothetical protein